MLSMSRNELYTLREKGYRLEGDNWLKVPVQSHVDSSLKVTRVCNGDTLAVVLIPADLIDVVEKNPYW
ncbi:hypothetical protein [Geobacter argillaceus]|uniref:Uncharacterized protein n=1 Tax=Geobacter argillaceus TaxID=345631 RepID=A0A562WRR4_9BACT|nr:hypothetical protein [Geobacter argillaceus]TWJ32507.1 hypothetical protein JN12_00948 [Geobacter argillaceus]